QRHVIHSVPTTCRTGFGSLSCKKLGLLRMSAGGRVGAGDRLMPQAVGEDGQGSTTASASRLIGESEAMQRLRRLIGALGARDCTVLIHGESGTGKELTAREIHHRSARSGGPFVPVDCTTLRDSLFESQLFGHVRGAFTGADRPTLGFFRSADRGTLFLD